MAEYDLTKIPNLPLLNEISIDPNGYCVLDQNGITYKVKVSAFLNSANNFTDLSDTPDSYADQADKVLSVKTDQTGLEFIEAQEYELSTGTTDNDKIPTKGYVDDITGGGNFDKIKLIPDSGVTLTEEGQIKWNDDFYTPEHNTGLGLTITQGNNLYLVFYNDTGGTLAPGTSMHLLAGTVISGQLYPTFEIADPRDWQKVQGTIAITAHSVNNGSLGILALYAQEIEGVDTSGVGAGEQLYIAADGTGGITDTVPQWPNIAISIGGSYNSDVNGSIFYNVTSNINELFNGGWDGSIIESFDFRVTSDGVTITGALENADNTRDIVIKFASDFYTLDTTPAATIALTAGTDTNPQTNYVYIPESTKVLTVSTSGFPTSEHAKVAQLVLQSAATTQTNSGALRNQNINDHIKTTGDNGHILHIAERVRQLNAQWDNGTEGSLDSTGGNGYVSVTGGQVWQMHKQTFPSFDMSTGDTIKIVNDFTTAYRETGNLNTVTSYSTGSAWNNEWSKIVVWGVANKTGETSYIMCNIPSAGYNSEANAVADALNYADYTIPDAFKGVGFLIASFAIRISGGTITYNSGVGYQDLRGSIPSNIAGGGGGGGGVTSLLGLTDTPSAYTGQAGNFLRVNSTNSAVEFAPNSTSIVFSATPTFNFNNGLVQEMPLTGNTVPSISNVVDGGTYIITFAVDATGGYSIAPDSSFGSITDNSISAIISATANAEYIYTIVIRPGGAADSTKRFYTIESIGG